MDAFWTAIATVSPVLALTLVVQLREIHTKPREGPDRASMVSVLVTHMIAVACLVVALITALGQLLRPTIGRDDAYWVGLLPVSIAICVVLITPLLDILLAESSKPRRFLVLKYREVKGRFQARSGPKRKPVENSGPRTPPSD